MKYTRSDAIKKMGGVKCAGLSFIKGPDCPIPARLLTEQDINFSHLKSVGQNREALKAHVLILRMREPEKKFILLCCLCNQRMRHLAKEFGLKRIPQRAVSLYEQGWTLGQIAQEYKCCDSTVSNFLKRSGVKVQNFGGKRAWEIPGTRQKLMTERKKRFLTSERIKIAKQIHELYDGGDTLREIAHWFGISKGSVIAHLSLAVR